MLKYYGSQIHDLRTEYVLILYKATVERKAYIMAFLSDCLQATADRISFLGMVGVTLTRQMSFRSIEMPMYCYSEEPKYCNTKEPKYCYSEEPNYEY